MQTTSKQQVSSRGIGRRVTGVAAATLVASVTLTLAPTAASAFNIGGLIGTALSLRYGGGGHHGGSYSHHSRSHESSGREREYAHRDRDRDSGGKEKDATEVDATIPGAKSDTGSDGKISSRSQPSGPARNTLQASESDARTGKVASDEPTFAPSR